MHQSPLILIITGFVTGFLSPWIGLLLVNIKPNASRLLVIASFYSVLNLIIRSFSIPYGSSHLVIMTIFLYILIMINWRLSLLKASIPTIVGILVLMLSESLCLSIVIKVLELSLPDLLQGWLFLWSFLPQLVLVLIVIGVINRFNLHIFDFTDISPYNFDNFDKTRSDLVTVLISIMLLLLIFQFMLNMSLIYVSPYKFFKGISLETAGVLSSILMIAVFVIMVLIINKLLTLSRKENEYLLQLSYLSTLDELYTAVRAEGHDRINHLQTLYGFVQLENMDETRKYLEELMGDTIISQKHAVSGNPGLSALFYIKSGIATSQGIQFNLEIQSDVAQIAVPAYELTRILGNLINNAFDAVTDLEKEDRWVNVGVYEQGGDYVFRVANRGHIDPQTAKNIFSRGYTTKQGSHSGMGLYIIKLLVERYQGKIVLETAPDAVEFTVVLPKSKEGWEINALPGAKTGPEFKGALRTDG